VSKVRQLVRTIRASGQRQELLRTVIVKGNASGWWTNLQNEVINIPPRQLILDVCTHWDSTYQMLVRALELREVSISLLFSINNINNTNSR
jgi:hypothetical protein